MAKQRQPWDRLYDQIRITRSDSSVCIPPATATELDTLERQLGSRLPKSYRAFMERFGAGELVGWVRIHSVQPQQKGMLSVDGWTKRCRPTWKEYPQLYPNHETLAGMVYFATSGGGDAYAWNPAEVTRPRLPEYRFYHLPRHGEHAPEHAGDSFRELVEWSDRHVRSWRDTDPELVMEPGISFTPFHLRRKKSPPKHEAALWLAANRHTARDLVRAIRAGRTDAFPILADALEEAGCTNRDVLDSCRTGDPAVDGVWVLRVLTGDDSTDPA